MYSPKVRIKQLVHLTETDKVVTKMKIELKSASL